MEKVLMKIEYLGHSCFKLDDSLVVDPYKDNSVPGLSSLRTQAKKVICSHEHADHSGRECVDILPGECDFDIEEIPSWHDDKEGALRGSNTIFVIKKNGEKLVHLGDLGHFPNETQLEKISNADYLLIPVGGFYTIDAEMAVKICLATKPKNIIPMHYRTKTSGYPEIATVDSFAELCKEAEIEEKISFF